MADRDKTGEKGDKKRKKQFDSTSSVSDLDASGIVQSDKQKKKKKKELSELKEIDGSEKQEIAELREQLNRMDKKLEKAYTKLDVTVKEMNEKMVKILEKDKGVTHDSMKDIMLDMKEEFLKSVYKSIEVLEGKLFDKEKENDKLKQDVQTMGEKLKEQKETNETLRKKMMENEDKRCRNENNAEQYSRRNNIRIMGIEERHRSNGDTETTGETADIVIEKLNRNLNIGLSRYDIDIVHRLKPRKDGKKDIILRFLSRMMRDEVLRRKKRLKGTGIFLSEDLTQLNQQVYMCVRKKMADEVERVWTRNGTIFYKNKAGNVKAVKYEEYQHWVELPWPVQETNTANRRA